ncbi:MAG: enoyl-CoA hydratase [Candidatus Binatia bacterium]
MNETVLYQVADQVATITLNRPDRLNTMNAALLEEALEAIETAASDDAVRVVVLTGAGRGFCAGGDLSAGDVLSGGAIETDIGRLRRYMRTSELLHEMPKITIAAINGACAGAGLAWACAADLRYAAASAVFNTAFLTAGLSGDFGGSWTLTRLVGAARARELYFLPGRLSAAEAERIGVVSKTLPDEELAAHVRSVAQRLGASAPLTLRAIKQNLNDALEVGFAEMLDREADRHVRCGHTRDAREAARAFLEKRPPRFEGR